MTGREAVIPWFPLPEQITTGIEEPFMRASEPAAAKALARVFRSFPVFRSTFPMLAP